MPAMRAYMQCSGLLRLLAYRINYEHLVMLKIMIARHGFLSD